MIPVRDGWNDPRNPESLAASIVPRSVVPLGDRGFLARFDSEADADQWGRAVREPEWPGLVDRSIAYTSVGLFFDPDLADLASLENQLRHHAILRNEANFGREHEIPVLYDGLDLATSAEALGITVERLIELHAAQSYRVVAIGFLPGFPYAGYLPRELSGLSRLASPRVRVPAGSVAMVGRQTAIYPGESPGGWRLIGRTPLRMVDLATEYFPIEAGDRLRFLPIEAKSFAERLGERL